jgi:phosphohistidine phosphatase
MRLFLMRHANTEAAGNKEDFQRELTEIGKDEASRAATFLRDYQIDKILVSYVKRTMQTSNIILEQTEVAEIEMVTELYGENEEAAMNLLLTQEERNKHILVIGHNPVIYRLALALANPESENYEQLVQTSMPPSRVIVIDFQGINAWDQIEETKGEIVKIFTA